MELEIQKEMIRNTKKPQCGLQYIINIFNEHVELGIQTEVIQEHKNPQTGLQYCITLINVLVYL